MNTKLFLQLMGILGALAAVPVASASYPDLKMAKGTVLIAAPTALNGPTNQGVWFINPATKMLSVELPELPINQVYEGWVVNEKTGMKLSTGLFRSNGMIDSDAAGKYAGPLALNFPQVPGSDFVKLRQSLVEGRHLVVITVEPYPDSDPAPSSVVVLKASIPMGVAVGTQITFENVVH